MLPTGESAFCLRHQTQNLKVTKKFFAFEKKANDLAEIIPGKGHEKGIGRIGVILFFLNFLCYVDTKRGIKFFYIEKSE